MTVTARNYSHCSWIQCVQTIAKVFAGVRIPGQLAISLEIFFWTESNKSLYVLKTIVSYGKATKLYDVTGIRATRIHTEVTITVTKHKNRILLCHNNYSSKVWQLSDCDVQRGVLHKSCFDNVNCSVCSQKAFLFAEFCSTCMAASSVRSGNYLCITNISIYSRPFHGPHILQHFSEQELASQTNELNHLLRELPSAKASREPGTLRLRSNRGSKKNIETRTVDEKLQECLEASRTAAQVHLEPQSLETKINNCQVHTYQGKRMDGSFKWITMVDRRDSYVSYKENCLAKIFLNKTEPNWWVSAYQACSKLKYFPFFILFRD